MCQLEEKEMLCANISSVIDQCPPHDTFIVLGHFSVATSTKRVGYELCFGHHSSGTGNTISLLVLELHKVKNAEDY